MWDQKIPSYIYGKQNIVRLILWTALFALVFINIYKPFSSTSWYKVSEFKFFVFSSLIISVSYTHLTLPTKLEV